MSAYTNNTTYAPHSLMGQTNLVNGSLTPQQPQQQPHQFPQQQENVFQQKQQHQLPPTLGGNLSKFLPTSSANLAAAPPSSSTLNGPQQALPPHLRPQGLNGPPAMPFTNINGGGSSANSSRTASPSISHQQKTFVGDQPAQQPNIPVALLPPTSFAETLTGSMQSLNINRTNGVATLMQQSKLPPPSSFGNGGAAPQQFPTNFQGNFKTSALNTASSIPQPPTSTSAGGIFKPLNPSLQSPLSSAAYNAQPTLQQFNNLPAPLSTQQVTNVYGSSAMPQQQQQHLLQQQPPKQQHNPYLPPKNSIGERPVLQQLPPTTALQQNQLNNNQQQPLRKPMYPTTTQLPSMPGRPNEPQLQPYSQAYHQQQPPPPPPPAGLFNGQPNTGPLQYQPQQQSCPVSTQNLYNNQQLNVTQQGFSQLWGQDTIDLMQNRHILTSATLARPKIVLHNQFHESINCNPNIMRCTIAKIPESNSLLQKSRLPLGILIHPFRDINSLPVIQCPNIVRCRLCRTYINPFVYFVDSKMWKCNLCYRVNELPEDFQFDPATKTYGDVTRRPEVRSSTIEFIAPSEYMLRPPQPAIYLFLFDVSIIAQQCGYLENACATLSKHLDHMPGDARAQVGFIAYNSQVHFYSIAEGYYQPHEITLIDIEDPFLPRPDNLLVNLKECNKLIRDLLKQLPKRFADTHDPGSALGAALQVAYKLMQGSGGRITVFQTCLPNKGPGSLEPREDPNNRSAKDVAHLNPATDFYKRYALECSGFQIAVDLFLLNQQYCDLATISGISKHSGGCVHHFPLYQHTKPQNVDSFKQCLKRYLTRKIGFEAVMRIRCTRGLQVHTFHGNFFVRSTDLLSLPNVNPDAGYGMQISYEESLTDVKTICFQAALLYTNSEGERRIRVHTLCLPVTGSLSELMHAADSEAIIGLLSKMAVDRSISSNVADAREAFLNATVDVLSAFKIAQNLPSGQAGQLIAPRSLALMPLYISSLLKHPAFRVGTSTRLDDRVHAMDSMKTLPLDQLIKYIYPEFYKIDALFYHVQNLNANATDEDDDDEYDLPVLPRLQLSAEHLDSRSTFLMDCGDLIIIYVGLNVPTNILENTLGVKSTAELSDYFYGMPNVNSPENDVLKRFIKRLNDEKAYEPIVQIIRDTSTAKPQFIEKLVDDRSESSLSYYEFLQHIRTQVK